jgi:glycosyltransferase involved in cell wall biosynthesis
MLRVLHVVWNLIRGGTEGQCARLSIELVRRGHPQSVAVFRREGGLLESVEASCGPAYEIGIRKMLSADTFRRVGHLAQYMRQGAFDLIHCWDADSAIFGSAAALRAGIPYITSRRDLGQIYPKYKLLLMHWADQRAEAVMVNAEAVRRFVISSGVRPAKVRRIGNLVDLAEFDVGARQDVAWSAAMPPGRLVGHVARLDPEKDVATFIRAARLVADRVPDVSFVIAGDGREREALEHLAAELGMRGRLVFLGDVKEIPALVRRFAAGVLVSKVNEGLSNSILEYMAGVVPAVVTDCGGNRELVEEGRTGYVVPGRDPNAVADAVLKLLGDADAASRMGRMGREKVEAEYASEVVVPRVLALYQACVRIKS